MEGMLQKKSRGCNPQDILMQNRPATVTISVAFWRTIVKQFEITYPSVNNQLFTKPITALVIEPDTVNSQTGVMLFSHGWGSSRYVVQDRMEFTCEAFNLICVSVEYRQSGLDFDPDRGIGAYSPYDASFLQVFDVLNGLRAVCNLRSGINRKRLFHYGQSQGGHIALLSAIFAPHTFACVYPSSPLTFIDEVRKTWVGREFAPYELSIRNGIEHADLIQCPVYIETGTADEALPWEQHTRAMVERLQTLGKPVIYEYYQNGDHQLQPTTTKFEAFKKMAPDPLRKITNKYEDDFSAGRKIEIPCADKLLCIDWSKPAASSELFVWK